MNILQIKKLTKHFQGVKAINKLSFNIEKGTITTIVGPNGSGKTTLINALTGILPIDSGELVVNGVKLNKIKSAEILTYGIVRTFQNVRLFEQMKVIDNILVVLTERGVVHSIFEKHTKYHIKQSEDVLKKTGLWQKRDELASNLSYGQRKLLEIARALAVGMSSNIQIFLFDEPYAGLFPEMVKIVSSIIKELKQQGKTVVLIEHNMDLIRELSDNVVVMDAGQLLASGKPEEVLERKDVIEAYLGK